QQPGQKAICLVPQPELTLERLAQPHPDVFQAVHYLKLDPPAPADQGGAGSKKDPAKPREGFRAGLGRLARVGYVSRLTDAVFSLSLLARGRVPGRLAARAASLYQQLTAGEKAYRYHARAIRQNGWIVLQYWFLYLFNNWRSGFFGANDHEADWEMVCVYLSEWPTGETTPEWVAYASHDHAGDEVRRRWDDPDLEKVNEHPVIYAGAGSHASYFTAGEYLPELELPFLSPLIRLVEKQHEIWHRRLRQYEGPESMSGQRASSSIFHIPFVDYARGDGLSIGPGQDVEWAQPHVLSPTPPWVACYRGLWGLYAHDPFSGEDAPAGPMYNRDGSVRRAWYDPVGWAGLDKMPPPSAALDIIAVRQEALAARDIELQARIDEKSKELMGLGLEVAAMRGEPHMVQRHEAHQRRIRELAEKVERLRADQVAGQALIESLQDYARKLQEGEREPVRAHLQPVRQPASSQDLRTSRIAELWAAGSIGLMLLALVWLLLFRQEYLLHGLVAILALFLFLEAAFRGRLTHLVTGVTLGLVLICALVLLYEFFWQVVIVAVLAIGFYILWDNLREIWA
ncbi:MAG TPA: hypothetical protein VLY63_22650, partial [Anaerolineae bacterium]|nr:hypothetical protein [Anaerolineae bacterium]